RFCDMIGYPREDIIKQHPGVFLDEDSKKYFMDLTAKRDKTDRRAYQAYELVFQAHDGEKITTLISPQPLSDARGSYKGSFAVVTDITYRVKAEQELLEKERVLKSQARQLEETNTALKVLLEHRGKENEEHRRNLIATLNSLVFPYVDKLRRTRSDGEDEVYLDILEANLKEVASTFIGKRTIWEHNLTSAELEVADLVRHGKSSQEIAEILNISPTTVAFHRANIRKKIGLANRNINLAAYLRSRE
ncbi:MAG: PAS and helix-turn-helix domain-containing protein, partial [Deltaproteobacteria bacterium]|nr:PAS and helix-turn-helix domain-containing protein [Deltaproteobacteria bacterium]